MGRHATVRVRVRVVAGAAALAMAGFGPSAADAAPAGDLDRTFGAGFSPYEGLVVDESADNETGAEGLAIESNSDDIVTAGTSRDGAMLVQAFTPSGTPADGFGDRPGGTMPSYYAKVAFGGVDAGAHALVARPEGGLWAVGDYRFQVAGSGGGTALARLRGDGTVVQTVLGTAEQGTSVADATLQPLADRDRLVVAGTREVAGATPEETTSSFWVQGWTDADGTLDGGFGTGGTVGGAFNGGEGRAAAVAAQPDGKVLVAGVLGRYGPGGASDFMSDGIALARYDAAGAPDGELDDRGDSETAGKVFSPLPGVQVQDVLVLSTGQILVLGSRAGHLVLVRYSDGGNIDATFATDGILELAAPGGGALTGKAMTEDGQGRILLGAVTDADGRWVTLRLNRDGSEDRTFGIRVTGIPDDATAKLDLGAVAIQNGKLLAAGWVADQPSQASHGGVVLARFLTEETTDATPQPPGDGGGTTTTPPADDGGLRPPSRTPTSQVAPPPPPGPAPQPDPFLQSPVGGTLQQLFRIVGLHAVEDPVIDQPVDYGPYRSRHTKPAGTQIGSTSRRQRLRFWTYGGSSNDVRRLTDRGLVHVNTIPRGLAFDDLPEGHDVHLPGGMTLPSDYDEAIEPYAIVRQSPPPTARGAFRGTTTRPARVRLYYWDPSKDVGRHPCYELPDRLANAQGWDAASKLIHDYRGKRCSVQVNFRDLRNANVVTQITKVRRLSRRKVVVDVVRPKQPDLAVTLQPAGNTQNPSFDDRWRMSTDTGASNNALKVAVTDRAVHAVGSGASARVSGAIAHARVELWFDPKGGHSRDYLLDADETSSRGVTPTMTFRIDRPGTVDVVVTATPKEGPPLEGWTSFPVVDHGACIRGVSGFVWRRQGSRYVANYRSGTTSYLYTDCGSARGRAAADDPNSPWHRFLRFIGIEPERAEQAVATSRPAPVQCAAKAASATLGILPSQTALGAPLSSSPAPPALRAASVIASGGGNLGAGTTTVADLGKDGTALTGAGVIASGGGNVIAPGGGNSAHFRGRAAQAGSSCRAAVPRAATDLFRSSFNVAPVIASGGGNVIAAGGGNVIASGGGNAIDIRSASVIASGGGNVIASGGGNVIASGGGNVIAAGGGNVIASGALN